MYRSDSKTMSFDSLLRESIHNDFRKDMIRAKELLEAETGVFSSSDNDYEIATYKEEGFVIVFYPHTTRSTGNQHIRIRVQGKKKNSDRAHYIMARLKSLDCGCTFSWKGMNHNQLMEWNKKFGIE